MAVARKFSVSYSFSMEKTWIHEAVYQIYPRSFCDSNGDGIGDLKGIISKLDYLKELGVGIVWLSPIYASPLFDMGYDVADYYKIHPDYGTMEDFDELLREAKKRDLKIVMDLVVNHTSDQHPWFQAALKGEQPYADYYIFKKGKGKGVPPNNWTSMFTGSAWEYVPSLDSWYLHLYDKAQPDLNWHNPAVLEEVERILRFYLDKGVYGFRCDVINQIYKESYDDGKGKNPSGRGQEHYLMTEGNHRILRKLYENVFSHYEDVVVIGETFNVDIPNGLRFLKEHELDMFFTFEHMGVDKSIAGAFRKKFKPAKLREILYKYQREIPWNANYFENHDQPRSVGRFTELGPRRDDGAKALAALLLTLKGTPFIFQGQELGVINAPKKDPSQSLDCATQAVARLCKNMHLPKRLIYSVCNNIDRDGCRAPMPWDEGEGQGFTTSNSPWLPYAESPSTHNAKEEENSANSVLIFYRNLLKLRHDRPELRTGDFKEIETKGGLFAYYRCIQTKGLLVLVNLSKKPAKLPAYLRRVSGNVVIENAAGSKPGYLGPYGCKIIDIG